MSSAAVRRANFYGIPKAPRRLASPLCPTSIVPRKQAEGQSPVSSYVDSSKLDIILTQSGTTYSARDMPLRTSEILHIAAFKGKLPSCTSTVSVASGNYKFQN